jgi:hypothetical protein
MLSAERRRKRIIVLLVSSLFALGLVTTATVASATSTTSASSTNQVMNMAALAACPDQNNPACCPPTDRECTVFGGDDRPNHPGGGNDPSGPRVCRWLGAVVPCTSVLGNYIGNGCYIKIADPQPLITNPDKIGTGAWYVKSCYLGGGGVAALVEWFDNPPAVPPSPEELARRALASIRLDPVAVGFAPSPGTAGLVGLPVWMWTEVSPNTWGPIRASATDTGLTVTISAQAQHIVWDMGNGDSVTCANPGTKYQASYGAQSSPNCGYTYRAPSRNRPGGQYTVTATTTWQVNWTGGGEAGVITTTRTTNFAVRIDELQVVVS